MRLSRLSRRLHRSGAIIVGLPLFCVVTTGLLLQVKKRVPWVQPTEHRTEHVVPGVDWGIMIASAKAVPGAGVRGWEDIDRVDVRPGKGILKIVTVSRWEVQLAITSGEVLQVAYRRSDLIESLHDGSFFGDIAKSWIFLPAGIVLLGLWMSGLYLWFLPRLTRRKRARLRSAHDRTTRRADGVTTVTLATIIAIAEATVAIAAAASVLVGPALTAQSVPRARAAVPYVPGPVWERRSPSAMGLDSMKLAEAIAFAVQSESRGSRDMEENHYRNSFGREPFGQGIGPFKPRGDPSGVVLRGGYIVASWGEPDRVDMTHSVTKSFLSITVGIAHDRGLIPSVRDTVWRSQAPMYALRLQAPSEPGARYGQSMFIDPWATPHNRTIIWDDLLRQTSDWEGTLWGKPEWADRPLPNPTEWTTRARKTPGTAYEYNDVRVNVLALAATNVWRRPLPDVLNEFVMEPIGSSRTWRWNGYDNAWITLDGRPVQVVSGGGHWGGGMFINAWDMARLGLLTQRRGMWGERRILSEEWVKLSLTPTAPQPTYGYMNWYLNTDRKWMPNAPASAYGHVGNGTNLVFVAPEQDLVIVVRWIENGAINEFLGKALGAIAR